MQLRNIFYQTNINKKNYLACNVYTVLQIRKHYVYILKFYIYIFCKGVAHKLNILLNHRALRRIHCIEKNYNLVIKYSCCLFYLRKKHIVVFYRERNLGYDTGCLCYNNVAEYLRLQYVEYVHFVEFYKTLLRRETPPPFPPPRSGGRKIASQMEKIYIVQVNTYYVCTDILVYSQTRRFKLSIKFARGHFSNLQIRHCANNVRIISLKMWYHMSALLGFGRHMYLKNIVNWNSLKP